MSYWEERLTTYTFPPELDSLCRRIIENVGDEVETYRLHHPRQAQVLFNVERIHLDPDFMDISLERIEKVMVELREFYKDFYTVHKQGIVHVTWEPILEWNCLRGPPGMIQLHATDLEEWRRPHLHEETHHHWKLCSIL